MCATPDLSTIPTEQQKGAPNLQENVALLLCGARVLFFSIGYPFHNAFPRIMGFNVESSITYFDKVVKVFFDNYYEKYQY